MYEVLLKALKLLLQFPTGSHSDEPDTNESEPVAAVYFMKDGSWTFRASPTGTDEELDIIKEFVEFIFYAKDRDDIVRDFLLFKRKTGNDVYDTWRRENIKLIKTSKPDDLQ